MPERPVLSTRRLVLVPHTVAAARALLCGDDPGFPLTKGYPHADTLDALRMLAGSGSDDDGGWFISLRESGEVVGDCGTKGWVDDHGRVEIGYGLAGAQRGRGIATEAVGVLVEWLQAQPDVRTVIAEVEVGNVASRRLLERLGFSVIEQTRTSWWFALPAAPSAYAALPGAP